MTVRPAPAPTRASRRRRGSGGPGGLGDDPVDGGLEAHVEHPVGLVDDQHLDPVEGERATVEQVLEPPGRGDDDMGPRGPLGLLLEPDAAVDGGDREGAGGRDVVQLVHDLKRELAGRREAERRRAPGLGRDQVDERHPEGEGLARAGRRLDEHIVPVEHVGDHQFLYGERRGDPAFG